MNTPVIIAAGNEEQYIGRTLSRMNPTHFEPIVVLNGSSDRTGDIVRNYGLEPIEREEAGKLPAIQEGLRVLGDRALGPVLLTDADSYPLRPFGWLRVMNQHLRATEGPAVVSGVTALCDGNKLAMGVRVFRRYQEARAAQRSGETSAVYGYNMGIKLANVAVLHAILDLPHIWLGEDKKIADVIREHGGSFDQLLSLDSAVVTSARYHPSLTRRIFRGREVTTQDVQRSYEQRAADSVQFMYHDGALVDSSPGSSL